MCTRRSPPSARPLKLNRLSSQDCSRACFSSQQIVKTSSALRWKNKAHLVYLCHVSVQSCVSNLEEEVDSLNSLKHKLYIPHKIWLYTTTTTTTELRVYSMTTSVRSGHTQLNQPTAKRPSPRQDKQLISIFKLGVQLPDPKPLCLP